MRGMGKGGAKDRQVCSTCDSLIAPVEIANRVSLLESPTTLLDSQIGPGARVRSPMAAAIAITITITNCAACCYFWPTLEFPDHCEKQIKGKFTRHRQQPAHTQWRRTNADTRKYTDTHVWLIRQCVRGALAKFSADFFFLFSVFLNRPPSD